jgi:DUF1009 family protein
MRLSRDTSREVREGAAGALRVAGEAKIRAIAVEAGRTLLLEKAALIDFAERSRISLVGR